MTFKPGRLAEILLNSVDVSGYFSSTSWETTVGTKEISTFKQSWVTFLSTLAKSTLSATGFYQSDDIDKVRDTLQAAVGQVSFAPAGATVIGDQVRMLNINSADYRNTSNRDGAVDMIWSAISTATVGIGVSLHPLAQESVGTITGTGDGVYTSAQSTTGAIGHLHVTQVSAATSSSFKFQDATTIGGAYTDIASGAFVNVTAVGSQRLIIPGTIRQFVRCVAVIGPATTTYAVSFART
jgi:hypothetical protein